MRLPHSIGRRLAVAVAIAGSVASSSAQAHFIWLAPCVDKQEIPAEGQSPSSLEVFFGEDASPDNPDLLDRLSGMKVWRLAEGQEPESIQPVKADDSLSVKLGDDETKRQSSLFVATHDLGVRTKAEESFRLVYYAKTGPQASAKIWGTDEAAKLIALDVVPVASGGNVRLTASFSGTAAAGAEVKVRGADGKDVTGKTNDEGVYTFPITLAGRYAIRVRYVEQASGKVIDKAYDSVRHYTTLTLDVPETMVPMPTDAAYQLPELPVTLTSFGGAMNGNDLYVYGGTMGSSHDYYKGAQNGSLMRLTLGAESKWETISEGPKLQGLALVAHGGKLYRIGGFEARNEKGEESSLWSSNSVASFDPATLQWTELATLPEPRSSFDAAVIGDHVYVVGGWAMAGDARSVWHETAWKMNLASEKPEWTAIAKAPFERRAIAVAAHEGKLYVIGGMTSGDETVLETDIYDPATDEWSRGPELVGNSGLTGFGASAFATNGHLYVTTVTGTLQKLSDDGSAWSVVGQTPTSRFFHRMLPVDDKRFVVVGGSNMSGRIKAVDVFKVR